MQRLQSKDLFCLPHRAVRAANAGKQPRAVHAGVDLNVAVHALAAPLQNLRHVAAVLQRTGIDGNAVVRRQLDLRVLQGAEQQDRLSTPALRMESASSMVATAYQSTSSSLYFAHTGVPWP